MVQEPVQEQNRAGQEPVQEPDALHWCTISDAASILHISERAIQKRMKAGTLLRQMVGTRVLVGVKVPEPVPEPVQELKIDVPELNEPVPEPVAVSESALLKHQAEEILFLRARLEAADVEKSELRRLMLADKNELSELRQRLAITAAPADVPEASTGNSGEQNGYQSASADDRAENSAQKRKTKWWHLWER